MNTFSQAPSSPSLKPLLLVRNLKVFYPIRGGIFGKVQNFVHAVDDISFSVNEGEILSLVGESGCGKSTTALALMGLTPVQSGEVWFENQSLNLTQKSSWKLLRKKMQMIFQDPATTLNPRLTVFELIAEPMLLHGLVCKKELKDAVAQSLIQVGLRPEMMHRFPHAFSGGQRQRISIARVLGIKPKLLFCDEIVSALDVSVQGQILELLVSLRDNLGVSMIFISHDLAVVKAISDRIAVMTGGKIVEEQKTENLFNAPQHPYTRVLMDAVPTLDRSHPPIVHETW